MVIDIIKRNWKNILSFIGIALLLTIVAWNLFVWLVAYLELGSIIPSISINQYGEAIPEIILFLVAIGLGSFALYNVINK